jgi:serine/threonine protein kinase
LKFPEDIPISDSLRDLLTKILTKDPKARIGMKEIENHPWVTEDLNEDEKEEWFKFVSLNDDPLDVTEDEVKKALTLKDRIKKKLSKFTHSLNKFSGGLRRRTRSMPSVEITDKNLLKQNFNSNKNKKDSIVDSSITKKIESDNSNKNILINSTVARSNTAPNNSYSILNNINTSSHNNSTTSNNAIHSSNHNTDANISKVKSTIYSDTTLNIQSQNNSNSISNTINVIKGLNHGNNSSSKSKEPNVKSSHISTIPKTFLNKDIENLRNSDNNEEEDGDINEDSSGEILYMSFDRKFKKRNNTQTELVKRKQQ